MLFTCSYVVEKHLEEENLQNGTKKSYWTLLQEQQGINETANATNEPVEAVTTIRRYGEIIKTQNKRAMRH